MRNFIASPVLLASVFLALAGTACGQLEGDPDKAPVLATIRGQLSNPDGFAAGPNMRVAIVWGAETGNVRVSQDVQVQPVFPSQFKLELRSLPPADALRVPDDSPKSHGPSECTSGYDPSSGSPPPTNATTLCDDAPPMAGGTPTPTPQPPAPPPSGGSSPTPPPAPGKLDPGTRIQSDDDWRLARPGDPFKVAVGTLVAYEDLNGNGALDLIDEKATAAVDRVVGVSDEIYVVYIEGTPTGELAELGLPKGFSQLLVPRCEAEATLDRGGVSEPTGAPAGGSATTPAASCDGKGNVVPIDTLFTLPLTGSPTLANLMCRGTGDVLSGGTVSGETTSVPPPQAASVQGEGAAGTAPPSMNYPAATDPKLHCKEDGSGFTYNECDSTPATVCGPQVSCTTMLSQRPSPMPDNWPCPAH
jgi:hypothetical protein